MLIPIGHESGTVRRQPVVTYGLMLACFAVFLYTNHLAGQADELASTRLHDAIQYLMDHPYLETPPRLAELLGPDFEDQRLAAQEAMQDAGFRQGVLGVDHMEQQAELDQRVTDAFAALDAHPLHRYGLVPAHPTVSGAFAHMFLHGGWLHLIGNLFLLFLTGCFIEDRWGRPLYLGFYLASGLAGAALFVSRFPDLAMPLVGASGAISGCMGAFLVRFWSTRIRMLYWFGFFVGTFTAPAWVMLPVWFVSEVLMAKVSEGPAPAGGGVAYWAHVGGFLFGAAVAGAVRLWRVEERFLEPAIEAKLAFVSNEGVGAALTAAEEGDPEAAFELLREELRRQPDNREAAQAFWDLAQRLGRGAQAAPALLRLIRDEVRSGDDALAVGHWQELSQSGAEVRIEPSLALRLFPVLVRAERREAAVAMLEGLLDGGSLQAVQILGVARAAGTHAPPTAERAARLALAAPDAGPAERAQAEALLAELGSAAPAGPAPARPSGAALAPATGVTGAADALKALGLAPPPSAAASPPDDPRTLHLDTSGEGLALDPDAPGGSDPSEAPAADTPAFDPDGFRLDDAGLDGASALEPAAEAAVDRHEPLALEESGESLALADPHASGGVAGEAEPEWGNLELGDEDSGEPAAPDPAGDEPAGAEPCDPTPAEVAPTPALRLLACVDAVPVALREDSLAIDVEGRGKLRLPLRNVGAVAVAAVQGLSARPVLVVDLALNWADRADARLRVVRLRSDRFDPRALVPGAESALDALRSLVERVLDGSGATPLPDAQAARGRPRFAGFADLAAYETEVLRARPEPS